MTASQAFRNTLIVLLTIAATYVAVVSLRIWIVLLLSVIIASALRPYVLALTLRRIPIGLAVILVYVAVFVALFILGALVLPSALSQLFIYLQDEGGLATRLIETQVWLQTVFKDLTGTTLNLGDPELIRNRVSAAILDIQAAAPSLAAEAGGLVGDVILMVVMGIYWITSRDQALNFLLQLFPINERGKIDKVFTEVETSLGAYVRGVMLVCSFVGVSNFLLLTLMQVPNAVTLAAIIALTTIIPIIGGYIGAGTAVALSLLNSPVSALLTFASFVLVQQVENHYLTPRTMSRSVNLNPILIIVFLFTGFAIGGISGAILAVPMGSTIITLLRYFVIEPIKDEAAPKIEGGIVLMPSDARNGGTTVLATTDDKGTKPVSVR